MNQQIQTPIFCAIDTTDIDHAMALAAAMQKAGCGIKLGLEFFNANGPRGVQEIKKFYEELPIFLDLKYHDIPNTVAGAMKAIAPLGVDFVNVHASGGLEMMKIASQSLKEESDKTGVDAPKILGVTILTSLDDQALSEIGYEAGTQARVGQLANLTKQAGLDGVVCSAREIELVQKACGSDFILMVPGIRPEGSQTGDQKRVMTPHMAMQSGATYLVIGRPITQAEDPEAAATEILGTIESLAA